MTYDQAVGYLFSSLGDIRGENFGLTRIEALVARLGHPERASKVIHIAGTNGKGSTGAMIESALRTAGRRTGFYSSPHLSKINERYRIDGRDVSDEAFTQAVERVRAACEAITADGGHHPTFFESVTALSFCIFEDAQVDYSIIEVGLGGRLDATNVVHPEVAVITPIDLDHESWLGSQPEVVAAEKAGILKPGSKAVLAAQSPRIRSTLHEHAAKAKVASVTEAPHPAEIAPDKHGRHQFTTDGREIQLNLAGRHQVDNACTAIAALHAVDIDDDAIRQGLETATWPGRLELIDTRRLQHRSLPEPRPEGSGFPRGAANNPSNRSLPVAAPGAPVEILLDAAHNPAGARRLAEFLADFHSHRRIRLIFGAARDKAVDEMAGWLFPAVDRVTLTRSKVTRSVSPETLRTIVDHHDLPIEIADSVPEALVREDDDLVVLAGSIFLVGEARQLITN